MDLRLILLRRPSEIQMVAERNKAIPSPMVQDDSDDPASTCSDKNFSMRDYVLAVRKRDISHNWPFPPKYLQMCVECGISGVLPPFDSRGLARYPTHEGCLILDPFQEEKIVPCVVQDGISVIIKMEGTDEHEKGTCMEGEIANVSEQVCLLSLSIDRNEHNKDRCSADSAARFKGGTMDGKQYISCKVSDLPKGMVSSVRSLQGQNEVDDFVSVSGNEDNHGSTVDDQIPELGHEVHRKAHNSFAKTSLSSGQRSENKSRRKGKPKKRTMADICARARPSSLEDLDRVNGSNWATDTSLMPYSSLSYIDNVCAFDERRGSLGTFGESKLQVHCSTKKHPRDEGLRDKYLHVKKRRTMVKKLTGMSKLRKTNLRV